MASVFIQQLTIDAAASVLAQDIHKALKTMDNSLPEWNELTYEWRARERDEAAQFLAAKRRKRMAKVLEMRTR